MSLKGPILTDISFKGESLTKSRNITPYRYDGQRVALSLIIVHTIATPFLRCVLPH